MKKLLLKALCCLLLFIYAISALTGAEKLPINYISADAKCEVGIAAATADTVSYKKGDVAVGSRFFELLFGKDKEEIRLCPGGDAFGILINEDGVTVTEVTEDSRLHIGDRIVRINGDEVFSGSDIENALCSSGGARITLSVIRNNEQINISTLPKKIDGEYKLGVKLRSQTAGIGTITFVDPKTHTFGGLGHGISDSLSDSFVSIKEASVLDVTLGSCKRGEPGRAGELTGVLKRDVRGSIYKNSECGVFGVLDESASTEGALPICKRSELQCGSAKIISTVKNGYKAYYDIEIYDIDTSSLGSKSFKIKVTDPALIAITGGIVRGMSGSPIIQNGKLVGAVTHVMLNDPKEGYGIFIENMLNASQNQAIAKAA